jgi:Kef-type K+ transport system membrane component KefB
MSGSFMSLVEVIRHFGFAAVGIHFVFTYAAAIVAGMFLCHVVASFLTGSAQRILRYVAMGMGAVLGLTFLVLTCINPVLTNAVFLLYSAYMLWRVGSLLKKSENR